MAYNDEKGGRPPMWDNVGEFNKDVEGFFESCTYSDEIPDIEGLAVYLDTTRKTILDYENKEEFSYTIKRIKERIFHSKKQLALSGKMNPTVFIFDSINNHGYKNVQRFDHTTGGEKINDMKLSEDQINKILDKL